MQLAHTTRQVGMKWNLVWRPRSQNVEADSLTNQNFDGFDVDKRVEVC